MAKRSKTASKTASLKNFRGKIEAKFERTLERTVERAMAIPQVERATKEARRAKETLDQALLDLRHKAIDLKAQPQDLIQKVGQRVLERAETIRSQVAETSYSPSWLKDLSLAPRASEEGEMDESREDSVEERAAGVVVETGKAKVTHATPKKKAATGTKTKKSRAGQAATDSKSVH